MIYKTSNNLEIKLEIIRKDNKNVYFRFTDDLVLKITCPIYLSQNNILKMLKENDAKIIKMYDKALAKYKDSELFIYLGKKYYIKIDENITGVEFRDNFVYTSSLKTLEEFYNSEVKRVFTMEVELAKKCFNNLPEFTLKFRKMKTRWGVCNRGRMTVTLNTLLLEKDITLLDYVIIHELCHFYEGNHGAKFWQLVSLAYPDYKNARKRLRE